MTGGTAPPRGRSTARLAAWVLAALAAVVAVLWSRVLFGGESFVQRDALTYLLPSRAELAAALQGGRLPEWTAGIGLGAPFAPNPIHGVVYPPAWLAALLPLSLGVDLTILLHVLLGAAGTAALSSRLGAGARGAAFAGATFAASGYVASMLANNNAQLLAWTPWVGCAAAVLAEAVDGHQARGTARAALLLAAALGAQLVVGEPAHVITAGLLAVALLLGRARRLGPAIGWLAASCAAAVALAAVAVLPALSLLGWSDRAAGLAADAAGWWAMPPARLAELLWPGMLGDPSPSGNLARVLADASAAGNGGGMSGPNWAFTVYLGGPVLLLAAWAGWRRGRRWLLLAAALFVLLAMGRAGALLPALRAIFPPERLVRSPEKHLLGAVILATALAGVGFDEAFRTGERSLRVAALWLLAVLGAGLAVLSLLGPGVARSAVAAAQAVAPAPDASRALRFAGVEGLVALCGMGLFAAALWGRAAAPRASRLAAPLAAAAALAPMAWNAWSFVPLAPREITLARPPVLEPVLAEVRKNAPPPRVYLGYADPAPTDFDSGVQLARSFVARAYTNLPARFGVQCLPGADSASSGPYTRFQELSLSMSMRRYARLLGVEWVLLREEAAASMPWRVAAHSEVGTVLLATDGVRPRGFVAPRWRLGSVEEALTALAAPGRDADLGLVVVEAGGPSSAASADAAPLSPCAVETPVPEEVRLRCDSPAAGWAVLLDQEAPGWSATVDGAPSPIARADGLFRAVAVSAGPHEVRFRYRTPGLRAGLAISLLAWLAWGLAWRRAAR